MSAYLVAVVYGTSRGVTRLAALDQFHITAAALSSLALMQVLLDPPGFPPAYSSIASVPTAAVHRI